MICPTCSSVLRWVSASAVVGFIALLLGAPLHAQSDTFQEAQKAYEIYDYQKAVTLFTEVAEDESMDEALRRDALRYLGRIHIGRDERQQARDAIEQLVGMEPPAVELNPNREPPPLMELYYEVRKQQQGGYSVREGPGLQTLAIMDFRNSSIYERERFDPLSKGFPSMIVNYLNGATDLKVIERMRVQWLLNELKLQQKTDVVDQSTAVKMGELLGATAVMFGNYTVVDDDQMRLSGRLVKVETGEILLSEKVVGEPDEFFSLVEELSRNLTRAINVEMEETELESGSRTQLLDAQLAYARGLDELEDGNYQAARNQFQQALEYDSNYTLAQNRLDSLEPMLASTKQDSTSTSNDGSLNDVNQ